MSKTEFTFLTYPIFPLPTETFTSLYYQEHFSSIQVMVKSPLKYFRSASFSSICLAQDILLTKLLTHLLICIIFLPQSIMLPWSVFLLKLHQGQECPLLLLIYSDSTHTSKCKSTSTFFKKFFWVFSEHRHPHHSFHCLSTALYLDLLLQLWFLKFCLADYSLFIHMSISLHPLAQMATMWHKCFKSSLHQHPLRDISNTS